MPRLFAGLSLPEDIRDRLAGLQQPLPSTRWISDEDLHLTLRFIGDVSPAQAQEFAANLEAIQFDPFSMRINGLNTFGGQDPRVLFAVVEADPALKDLARAADTAARRAGLKLDGRKFIPHVTLARFQVPRVEPLARYLSRHGGFRTEPFLMTEFVLFSAKPITGGGPYVVEQTFPSTLGVFDDTEWLEDDMPK